MSKKTIFESHRELMARRVTECATPWELAKELYMQYGLDPIGTRLSTRIGVEPVLAIVRSVPGGREYFKRFDPFSCVESNEGDFVVEKADVARRLAQFDEAELAELDHNLRVLTARPDDPRGWTYVRLASPEDMEQAVRLG